MTDREEFEKWYKSTNKGELSRFEIWQAATLAERERCALIAENYVEIIELKRMVLAREIRGVK